MTLPRSVELMESAGAFLHQGPYRFRLHRPPLLNQRAQGLRRDPVLHRIGGLVFPKHIQHLGQGRVWFLPSGLTGIIQEGIQTGGKGDGDYQ